MKGGAEGLAMNNTKVEMTSTIDGNEEQRRIKGMFYCCASCRLGRSETGLRQPFLGQKENVPKRLCSWG